MKKILSLSLVTTAILLNASEVTSLDTISVVETANSEIVKNEIGRASCRERVSRTV